MPILKLSVYQKGRHAAVSNYRYTMERKDETQLRQFDSKGIEELRNSIDILMKAVLNLKRRSRVVWNFEFKRIEIYALKKS